MVMSPEKMSGNFANDLGTKSAGANGSSNGTTSSRISYEKPGLLVVKELSDMLHTGLTQEQLAVCIELIEAGIPPRMLADFIKRSRDVF